MGDINMLRKIYLLRCLPIILPVILSGIVFKVTAQSTEQVKCLDSIGCYQKYYKECYEVVLQDFTPVLVHSFGIVTLEEEWAKLDNLTTEWNNRYATNRNWRIFIVIYGGKVNKIGELKERTRPLLYYLKETKKFDITSVIVVNGGFRKKFEFELWVSPSEKIYPPSCNSC